MAVLDYYAQTIRAELAARHLTQIGLADYLGIDRRTLDYRLRKERAWTVDELSKAADFLGLTYWQLSALAAEREKRVKKGQEL